MGFDLEQDDNYAQRRLEYVESRYRRGQFVLTGAQAQFQALRHTDGASDAELLQAQYRVKRAREQLEDILSALEFLEDQQYSASAVSQVG